MIQVHVTITIKNEKLVWKHGQHSWHFYLNVKYLEWPYRAFIKTPKNGKFCEDLLIEYDFEDFEAHSEPLSIVIIMVPKLVRQLGRSLLIKKSITNSHCVL